LEPERLAVGSEYVSVVTVVECWIVVVEVVAAAFVVAAVDVVVVAVAGNEA